jgi:uncharacterized protein (UPF0216 family)
MSSFSNIPDDILQQYMSAGSDFGFSAVNENELNGIVNKNSVEIDSIKQKLDMILELNSSCEGAIAVKAQYDELIKARMLEIEKVIIPLLLNIKKNGDKDYIFWPGKQRTAQCDLQINKLLGLTRAQL